MHTITRSTVLIASAALALAGAVAGLAGVRPLVDHLALAAEHRLAQVDLHLRFDVGAGRGAFAGPAGASGLAPGEEVAEHGA